MDNKATVRTTESVLGVKYLQSQGLYLSHNHKKLQLIFLTFQIFLSSTYLFSKDKFWFTYIKKESTKNQNNQEKKNTNHQTHKPEKPSTFPIDKSS